MNDTDTDPQSIAPDLAIGPDPHPAGPAGRLDRLKTATRVRVEETTTRVEHLRERSVLVDAAFAVYERDRMAAGSVLGSAIAFRLFLFFIPFIVFGVGLIGTLAGTVDDETFNETASLSGALAEQISVALSQPTSRAYLMLLAGLFLMMSAGRTLARALVASSSLAWLSGGKVTVKVRVVAAIIGIVSSLVVVSILTNRIRNELGIAVAGLSFGASALIYVVLFLLLMATLPRRTPDPGALLPGAVLTALVVAGMQAISQLYLPNRISGASDLYGGIGVATVALGWLFLFGRTLSFAFSLNAALFDRFGSLSQVIFALPVVRVLPRKSKGVRRYFGLDSEGRSVAAEQQEVPGDQAEAAERIMTVVTSLRPADEEQAPHEQIETAARRDVVTTGE